MGKPVWPNDSTSTFVVKASSWCEDAICSRNFFETSALETLLPILWVGWCCNICSINSLSQLELLPTLWLGWSYNICITNALSRLALQYLWRCKELISNEHFILIGYSCGRPLTNRIWLRRPLTKHYLFVSSKAVLVFCLHYLGIPKRKWPARRQKTRFFSYIYQWRDTLSMLFSFSSSSFVHSYHDDQ